MYTFEMVVYELNPCENKKKHQFEIWMKQTDVACKMQDVA